MRNLQNPYSAEERIPPLLLRASYFQLSPCSSPARAKFRDADEAENRRLVTRGRRRTKRSFESGDDHAAPIARQGDSAYPAFPRIPCRNQTFGHWCYINITLHPSELEGTFPIQFQIFTHLSQRYPCAPFRIPAPISKRAKPKHDTPAASRKKQGVEVSS